LPPLLALDAEVELTSQSGARLLPLSAFLLGPRRTALRADEVLSAILIPQAALTGRSVFLKLGARTHLVISIAMVAARITIDGNRIASAAISVGSCSGVARRLTLVEAALFGALLSDIAHFIRLEDVADALAPIDDIRASAGYRLKAATELVTRAVQEAVA
jgi:CO/xanthine dehydrogenase FAD-binding subunit